VAFYTTSTYTLELEAFIFILGLYLNSLTRHTTFISTNLVLTISFSNYYLIADIINKAPHILLLFLLNTTTGLNCYDLSFVLSKRHTLVLSNIRELDRELYTETSI